jgi:hypothetical protein
MLQPAIKVFYFAFFINYISKFIFAAYSKLFPSTIYEALLLVSHSQSQCVVSGGGQKGEEGKGGGGGHNKKKRAKKITSDYGTERKCQSRRTGRMDGGQEGHNDKKKINFPHM